MKKMLLSACVVVLLLGLSNVAAALSYEFSPTPVDLWDLDHGHAYTWGINFTLPEKQQIVGASLSFENIRNWRREKNDLWVHLLDSVSPGARRFKDSKSKPDNEFAGQGIELLHWQDKEFKPQNITYDFTEAALTMLNSYVSDGNFGFGFDPDCHFFNDGIKLTIETASAVPEPTTLLLVGVGLLGLAGFKRSAKK